MTALSELLRSEADAIWNAQHRHPFVQGIGDGTLDKEKFRFWIKQDYLFLIEYSRLLAITTARAPDLATMVSFAELLDETLHVEMTMHRSYCADIGISEADLERVTLAPTTRGYADFLLRTATVGDFADLLAALLPCMWGFNDIGLRLADAGAPADDDYRRWIDIYASDEFTALVGWLRELTDEVGEHLPTVVRERVRDVFLTSSRYELAFWDMAWNLEEWPSTS